MEFKKNSERKKNKKTAFKFLVKEHETKEEEKKTYSFMS